MASFVNLIDDSDDDSNNAKHAVEDDEKPSTSSTINIDCAICLEKCVHPVKIPCGHIFCFLCVKGVAYKNRRCALCRSDIPPEFIENPQLLYNIQDIKPISNDGYQWFYEGRNGGWWQYEIRTSDEIETAYRSKNSNFTTLICGSLYCIDLVNMLQYPIDSPTRKRNIKRNLVSNDYTKGIAGWWQYDERTSYDIEESYKKGDKYCTILVAGYVYVVDFENMLQQRQNDPLRRRQVKRDLSTIPKKGIAGLRLTNTTDNSNKYNQQRTTTIDTHYTDLVSRINNLSITTSPSSSSTAMQQFVISSAISSSSSIVQSLLSTISTVQSPTGSLIFPSTSSTNNVNTSTTLEIDRHDLIDTPIDNDINRNIYGDLINGIETDDHVTTTSMSTILNNLNNILESISSHSSSENADDESEDEENTCNDDDNDGDDDDDDDDEDEDEGDDEEEESQTYLDALFSNYMSLNDQEEWSTSSQSSDNNDIGSVNGDTESKQFI